MALDKGPGGKIVGKVSVKVVPDVSGFARELKAELKAIEQKLKVKIPVNLNTSGVSEEIKQAKEKAEKIEIELPVLVNGEQTIRDTRRIRRIAQAATGPIKLLATVDLKRSLVSIAAKMAVIQAGAKAYQLRIPVDLVGMFQLLSVLGAVSGGLLGLGHVIVGVGGAVSMLGAALATVPGLLVGAGAAIGVLVAGNAGMWNALINAGDPAIFKRKLEKLTPAAREAAKALAAVGKPFKEIQRATQETLFKGMADTFSKLERLMPAIKRGFVSIAGGIRDMGKAWIDMATTKGSVRDLDLILQNTGKGFEEAQPALADFGHALKDLAAVASTFFGRMGKSIANAARDFRDFIAAARKDGSLKKWMEEQFESWRTLGRTLKNVWDAFANIGDAMGFGGMLKTLEKFTGKLKNLTSEAKNTKGMKALGDVMREVMNLSWDVFAELLSSVAEILKEAKPFLMAFTRQLAVALTKALEVVTPLLKKLARFLSRNKEIAVPLAIALVSVVTGLKLISTAAKGLTVLFGGAKALGALLSVSKGSKSKLAATSAGLVGVGTGAATAGKAAGKAVKPVGLFAGTLKRLGKAAGVTAVAVAGLTAASSGVGDNIWDLGATDENIKDAKNVKKFRDLVVGKDGDWDLKDAPGLLSGGFMVVAEGVRYLSAKISGNGKALRHWKEDWGFLEKKLKAKLPFPKMTRQMLGLTNSQRGLNASTRNLKKGFNIYDALGLKVQKLGKKAPQLRNKFKGEYGGLITDTKMFGLKFGERLNDGMHKGVTGANRVVNRGTAMIGSTIVKGSQIAAGKARVFSNSVPKHFYKGMFSANKNTRIGLNGLSQTVADGSRKAADKASGFESRIKHWFNIDLSSSGFSLMQSFAQGIASGQGIIGSTINTALSAAKNYFPQSPAKTGPFSGRGYTTFSGMALVKDFAGAIEKSTPHAVRAVDGLMKAANFGSNAQWSNGFAGARAGAGNSTEINIGTVRAHDYNDFNRQLQRRALSASIPGGGTR